MHPYIVKSPYTLSRYCPAICKGKPLVTGGFLSQGDSNMDSVQMLWRRHAIRFEFSWSAEVFRDVELDAFTVFGTLSLPLASCLGGPSILGNNGPPSTCSLNLTGQRAIFQWCFLVFFLKAITHLIVYKLVIFNQIVSITAPQKLGNVITVSILECLRMLLACADNHLNVLAENNIIARGEIIIRLNYIPDAIKINGPILCILVSWIAISVIIQ